MNRQVVPQQALEGAALAVRELRAGYGGEDILKGVSIAVPRDSVVAIIGPNGSGKSTLLKTIFGVVPTRGGEVTWFGEDGAPVRLTGTRPAALARMGLNMVPQLANVFADMSVLENLEIGVLPIRARYRARLEAVLDALPLVRPMLSKRAATLSGGQRQMVALARALMSEPRVLILDEPSAGLAPKVQDEIFALIRHINTLGVTILMVEQRARQCLAIADYGYVLEQGRNRLEGPAAALLDDPEVIRLYLGGARPAALPVPP
jgi:ABC-type branched-subunit amino acid transport system ATPase component